MPFCFSFCAFMLTHTQQRLRQQCERIGNADKRIRNGFYWTNYSCSIIFIIYAFIKRTFFMGVELFLKSWPRTILTVCYHLHILCCNKYAKSLSLSPFRRLSTAGSNFKLNSVIDGELRDYFYSFGKCTTLASWFGDGNLTTVASAVCSGSHCPHL